MKDKEEKDLIDVLDESGCNTGVCRERLEVHTKGLWHRTIQCWIYWIEGIEITLILQRRSKSKRAWPEFLDASVAGHCKVGEGAIEACVRELFEEMGIIVDAPELISQGVRIVDSSDGNLINREFQDVYFLRMGSSVIETLRPNVQEVQEIVLMRLDHLMKLLTGQASRIKPISNFEVNQQNQLIQRDREEVTLTDLIPDQLTYLIEICRSLVAKHS